jgi:hypothetical protein
VTCLVVGECDFLIPENNEEEIPYLHEQLHNVHLLPRALAHSSRQEDKQSDQRRSKHHWQELHNKQGTHAMRPLQLLHWQPHFWITLLRLMLDEQKH